MPRNANQVFDELLVVNAQAGDRRAFGLLAAKWNATLRRQIYWKVRDLDIAQDLTQECWIAVARGLHKLKDPTKFPSWVGRIASNKATDWLRKNRRHPTQELREGDQIEDDDKQAVDMMAALRLAMSRLPLSQVEILRWHYLEEMGIVEIGDLLGVPEGTVKSRLFRAREHLKTIIRYHEKGG